MSGKAIHQLVSLQNKEVLTKCGETIKKIEKDGEKLWTAWWDHVTCPECKAKSPHVYVEKRTIHLVTSVTKYAMKTKCGVTMNQDDRNGGVGSAREDLVTCKKCLRKMSEEDEIEW